MADCVRTLGAVQLAIESEGARRWLNEPLVAVNWFRAKRPKLYTLYNALAASSARETGATLFFKGRVKEVLRGELTRDTLLLVAYPSAFRFLELPAKKRFQLISPLREHAVRRFSFAFQRRIDGPVHFPFFVCRESSGPASYAVFIAEGNEARLREGLPALREAAAEEGCSLHYAGHHAASLWAGRRPRPLPHVTPLLWLFRGPSDALRRLEQHPALRALNAKAALLERARL